MKKIFYTLILALGILCFNANRSWADHAEHPENIRAIKSSAKAIKKDAAIYQRKHVNSSVERIVEDTKKLEKAMSMHSCLKTEIIAIHKAVSDLRSASMEADANKTGDAVKRLSDLSDSVLRKYCKVETTYE